MPRGASVALLAVVVLAGCASTRVAFPNVTPGAPLRVPGWELRPAGEGPFPAVVLLHGCHGVSASPHDLARWFRGRGYVALIVDSLAAPGVRGGWRPRRARPPPARRLRRHGRPAGLPSA